MKEICFKSFEDVEKFSNLTLPENFFFNPPSIEKILEISINGEPYTFYKVWKDAESKIVLYKNVCKKKQENKEDKDNKDSIVDAIEDNTKDISIDIPNVFNSSNNDNDTFDNPDNLKTILTGSIPSKKDNSAKRTKTKEKQLKNQIKKQQYIQEMIEAGFEHKPDIDKINDEDYLYVNRDENGHVINTYKVQVDRNGDTFLQVGVPKANDKDYTIRTYFVTDVENFTVLKNHNWKVYADDEDYLGRQRYNVCYKYYDKVKDKIYTVKAIELIAQNLGLDKKFIKHNKLDENYGIGTGHNGINYKGGTFIDAKRISVFVNNGNDFLCFGWNLSLVLYVDVINRKNSRKNNISSTNNLNNKNTKGKNESKNRGIKDMMKAIRDITE